MTIALVYFAKNNLIFAKTEIGGDVYSQGGTQNLQVGQNSVLSSSGNINVDSGGRTTVFANYQAKQFSGSQKETINASVERLISNRVQREGVCDISSINFSNANPEGDIWHCSGELTIDLGANKFIGKGTVIADGKITIKSNLIANGNEDTLGLVSKTGNIEIDSTVKSIAGTAFYAAGNIDIK